MSTAASSAGGGGTQEQGRSELGVALFLGALGLLVIVSALLLPESRIARGPVGPGAVPVVVGGLLVITAGFLAVDVWRGGRGEPEGGEDIELTGRSDERRSEEHTSELQSRQYLVCRLLLEKKKRIT